MEQVSVDSRIVRIAEYLDGSDSRNIVAARSSREMLFAPVAVIVSDRITRIMLIFDSTGWLRCKFLNPFEFSLNVYA
jgi:hypothetical protein